MKTIYNKYNAGPKYDWGLQHTTEQNRTNEKKRVKFFNTTQKNER